MPNWFRIKTAPPTVPDEDAQVSEADLEAQAIAVAPKFPKKLSSAFSGALRTFSFWVANGTLGHPLLNGIEYRQAMIDSPSVLETVYAIFANVLEFDEDGVPLNAKYAEHRAAQYIRQYVDRTYIVVPKFESWEQELFAPPGIEDPKPWPRESAA